MSNAMSLRESAAPESLAELVGRATAGERAAESALCLRFLPLARTFARRRLHSRDAVNEFAQDVMLLLVEALRDGTVADPARVAGFVLGICRNLARDRARTQERRTTLWAAFGDPVTSVEADDAAKTRREAIHLEDCLSQLSDRARRVIRHTFIDEASSAQVAEWLSLDEGNVRVVRHRTLKALRDCMSKQMTWEAA